MLQRDHLLGAHVVFVAQDEFHIDGIGVPQGNSGLKPFEQHMIFAAEWIRTGVELAKLKHLAAILQWGGCSPPNWLLRANSAWRNRSFRRPAPAKSRFTWMQSES